MTVAVHDVITPLDQRVRAGHRALPPAADRAGPAGAAPRWRRPRWPPRRPSTPATPVAAPAAGRLRHPGRRRRPGLRGRAGGRGRLVVRRGRPADADRADRADQPAVAADNGLCVTDAPPPVRRDHPVRPAGGGRRAATAAAARCSTSTARDPGRARRGPADQQPHRQPAVGRPEALLEPTPELAGQRRVGDQQRGPANQPRGPAGGCPVRRRGPAGPNRRRDPPPVGRVA